MRRSIRGSLWRVAARVNPPREVYRLHSAASGKASREFDARRSFAVVIPVVHPEHPNVGDYAVVERHLEFTVGSIARQSHGRVSTIIVGHRRPGWIDNPALPVHFIDIEASREVRGQLATPLDKGVKTLVGARIARERLGADVVLTADADDFLEVDLARKLERYLRTHPESNGVVWTRGYELTVASGDDDVAIAIDDAYLVDQFDRACGTSRAITMSSLDRRMAAAGDELTPVAEAVGEQVGAASDHYVHVEHDAAAILDRAVQGLSQTALEELDHLGRHITPYFALDAVPLVGAAKMCGHGQHDGPIGGGIHWKRVRSRVHPAKALARCGLEVTSEG